MTGALSSSPFLSTREHRYIVFKMICESELLNKYLDDHILLALLCFRLPVLIKRKSEYIEHVSTAALFKLVAFIATWILFSHPHGD